MSLQSQNTIVIIDDEAEFTQAFGEFFRARGYDIHVALSGPTGMKLVEELHPRVVLTDLKMPGMDGDEVLKALLNRHPEVRVIIISAYNDAGKTRDRLLALGAYAYFDKPVSSLRELAATVKAAIEEGAQADS